jgi:hypothetical protein
MWLKIIGPSITFLALLVAASTLLRNLERARRELAVKLMWDWSGEFTWETSRAIALAVSLNSSAHGREALEQIIGRKPADIPINVYEDVAIVLEKNFPSGDKLIRPENGSQTFQLTLQQSALIRFVWARWLNRLEAVLAGWQQAIADRQLMVDQFSPYVAENKAEINALEGLLD